LSGVSNPRWALAVAIALMAACAGDPPQSHGSPWLTDEDFKIAGLEDDADSVAVLRALGEPDSIISLPDPDDPDVELLAWAYPDLAVAFGEGGIRYGVTLIAPGVATRRGLKVGDAKARLLELYGRPPHAFGATWDYLAPDDEDGLHVMRVGFSGDRISWIFLGWLLE
jgi:hypothetical protein